MKRILLVSCEGLGNGGVQAVIMSIVRNLHKEYLFDILLFTSEKRYYDEEFLIYGGQIFRIPRYEGKNQFRKKIDYYVRGRNLYNNVRKILKEKGPFDVIHCNMDLFNGINLMAAKKAGIPVRICHSHNSESQYSTSFLKKIMSRTYRIFMRKMIYKYSTNMLGCSELANDYLYGENWKNDARCKVLYNGIDLKKFRFHDKIKETERKNIMTIGRFGEQKNPFFLLEILIELLNIRKDINFSWVGDGELRKPIEERVKEEHLEKHIHFLGRREDIPELLQQNDFFLFPSLFEGLPITLIEAQASGLECFISDTITKEVNVGLCQYLSLEKTAKEWAVYISEQLDNRDKKGYDAKLLDQFDIKNTVRRLEEIYG